MDSSLSGSQCPTPCDHSSLKNRKVVTFSAAINQSLKTKCHGKFCSLCQRFFSNLWWPGGVETHSLLVFSLCWLLSAPTKLSRLAAGIRVLIFWVLWTLLPHEAWWHTLEWAGATGVSNFWLFLTCHTSALVWVTSECSRFRGCILDPAQCPFWKADATLASCWIYSKYLQPQGRKCSCQAACVERLCTIQ